MNIITVILAMFLISCVHESSSSFTPQVIRDIVNITYNDYYRGCTVIISPYTYKESRETFYVYSILREIQSLFISVMLKSIEDLDRSARDSLCYPNNPLFVILSTDNQTKEVLQFLSTNFTLAAPGWLIFYTSELKIEEYFRDIYIPFKCKFLVVQEQNDGFVLSELYQFINSSVLEINHYGYWDLKFGLDTRNKTPRSEDLNGITLFAASSANFFLKPGEKPYMDSRLDAALFDLSEIFQKFLNFKIKWKHAPDRSTLSTVKRSVLTELLSSRVHIIFDANGFVAKMFPHGEYTRLLFHVRQSVYIKKPTRNEMKWSALLRPFSRSLWSVILAGTFFIIICYFVIVNWSIKNGTEEILDNSPYTFKDVAFSIISLFLLKGMETVPDSSSSRVVLLGFFIIVLVVTTVYSATLIAYLSTDVLKLPFNDLRGYLKNGKYKFIVGNEVDTHAYFKISKDQVLQEVFKHVQNNEHYDKIINHYDSIKYMCDNEYVATMFPGFFYLKYVHSLHCEVTELPKESIMTYSTLLLTKYSWYTETLNIAIVKLLNVGVLKKLRLSLDSPKQLEDDIALHPVMFEDIVVFVILLCSGYLLSFLILYIERIYCYVYGKMNKQVAQ